MNGHDHDGLEYTVSSTGKLSLSEGSCHGNVAFRYRVAGKKILHPSLYVRNRELFALSILCDNPLVWM